MKTLNLYPYNLYILLAACLLLLIFVIIFFQHLAKFGAAVQANEPIFQSMSKHSLEIDSKVTTIQSNVEKIASLVQKSIPVLLFLAAIHSDYKSDRKQGKKRGTSIHHAVNHTLQQKQNEERIAKAILRGMKF